MKTEKHQTETYVITEDGLDPVTVYVTNYQPGRGKIVIECFCQAWASYWGGMGGRAIQEFVLDSDNDYLLGKLLNETRQTDFEEINDLANKRGHPDICVTNDVEVAMQARAMAKCFGSDWMMDLPRCNTSEYHYVGRILNAIKAAFRDEHKEAA